MDAQRQSATMNDQGRDGEYQLRRDLGFGIRDLMDITTASCQIPNPESRIPSTRNMGQPAAKQGDRIVAIDTHIVMAPPAPPQPLPHPFVGTINGGLSGNVNIMGMPAATVGSTADNTLPHIPTPPGTAFQAPPVEQGHRQGRQSNREHQRQDGRAQRRRRR